MRLPFVRTLAGSVAPTPPTTDPNFENVTLLLHGDGTNGGQNNTFVDGSTNNFAITRNGNTTQGTFSPYGDRWSNYFDGTGDYLSIPDNAAFDFGTGDFTIECWAYISGNSSLDNGGSRVAGIFSGYTTTGTSTSSYTFEILGSPTTTGTGLGFYNNVSNVQTSVVATTAIAQNTWHHIAVARSGTTTRLFLNGSLVGSGTLGNQNVNTDYTINIGRLGLANYLQEFNGYISNLRVLKGTALYTGSYTVPTAPLTAITNTSLLTCQSNGFRDTSTNNFAITSNGDVSVQRFSPFSPTATYAAGTIGGSGYFDGTGDYLLTPTNAALSVGTGDFTCETFVYFNALEANNHGIVSQLTVGDGANHSIVFFTVGSTVYLRVQSLSALAFEGTATVSVGQWYHFALVRSGTNIAAFVNGSRINSGTNSTNIVKQVFAVGRLYSSTDQEYSKAYVSNFRLVKGSAVYNPTQTTLTVPTSPLTAITNSSLLLNFTNGAILDNAMMADLETVGNAQISTTVKKYGTGSLAFDGTGDYLSAPFDNGRVFGTGDFTIEYWINPTSNTSGCMIDLRSTELGAGGVAYSDYFTPTGKLGIYISGGTYVSTSTVQTGQWTHIAVSRLGTALRVFFNGIQDGSTVTNSQNLVGGPLKVGISVALGGPFTGYLDDIRITKGVARYTTNFSPGPIAAFPDL